MGMNWLARYENTDVSHQGIQSIQRICPAIADGFVISGHWGPWPDDMLQFDSDRYVLWLEPYVYLMSLLLEFMDQSGLDLEVKLGYACHGWVKM